MSLSASLDSALSGMRSASARIAVSAHNVANARSEEFRPLRARQEESPDGGSRVRVERAETPREVSFAHEMLEQTLASTQFEASLRVAGVSGRLQGQLIDLLA